mmetsp:Transcript_26598/g.58399  ORF Transcript_26598/g.58399 Transcript_26598/m.58399 type:complete len:112 (-) Transcript_26598:68-403(-)
MAALQHPSVVMMTLSAEHHRNGGTLLRSAQRWAYLDMLVAAQLHEGCRRTAARTAQTRQLLARLRQGVELLAVLRVARRHWCWDDDSLQLCSASTEALPLERPERATQCRL